MAHRLTSGWSLVCVIVLGCGGATEPQGEGDGEGGEAQFGGRPAMGGGGAGNPTRGGAPGGPRAGSGGVGGSGATAGTGTAGAVGCCGAAATCMPGETALYDKGMQDCPPGADCYVNSICCSTVLCIRNPPQCTALPTCDLGHQQFNSPCPPIEGCYSRTVCGSTIWCYDTSSQGGTGGSAGSAGAGGASAGAGGTSPICERELHFNRRYISTDPLECSLLDFACEPNTTHFADVCGCGCQQDPSCLESIYCTPDARDAAPARPLPPPQGGSSGGSGIAPPPPLRSCTEALKLCPFSKLIEL